MDANDPSAYHHAIPGLDRFYLEESALLGLQYEGTLLSFYLDLVLTEIHPDYRSPKAHEQYCRQKGVLTFTGVTDLRINDLKLIGLEAWSKGPFLNADFGEVDWLAFKDGVYSIGGDWGELLFRAENVSVALRQKHWRDIIGGLFVAEKRPD